MPTLHFLGTGAALSDPHRTTTMLALTDGDETLVVDCGGDVGQRLMEAERGLETVAGLIITHEHPDHVAGLPLFLVKLHLSGRIVPLRIYGIPSALAAARKYAEAGGLWEKPGMFDLVWVPIGEQEDARVIDSPTWRIISAPVQHSVPCIGLRAEHKTSGAIVAYSCDTEPTPSVARLARGADVLVHEATGDWAGHSTAAQAAGIARDAEAKRLVLVHLPPGPHDADLAKARATFAATSLGTEGGSIAL